MSNLLAILIIGLTIYMLVKKGIKEAIGVFLFGCVLISAIQTKNNLSVVGNSIWSLIRQLVGGVNLG